ncbi:hypothetical protein C8J48_0982 [Desmospora activa DSM 45169]|uniref:Uncharacterized protein n=1 Tax=Desmospora activa DSM 45169 TaxID=1121389 RepID=A0A2T4Z942_9BACL|nr:hypothetical protein C8J48_0982 [Desmospora activa DSM 45169]
MILQIIASIISIIVVFLVKKYRNLTWIQVASLFFFVTPLFLILFIFLVHGNYDLYIWLIKQDCWYCTGSGPGLASVGVKLLFISLLGLLFFWVSSKTK